MGQQTSSKRCAQIDNSEKVQVPADLLRCPVCLEVFFSTPLILQCGHSFCKQCLNRLCKTSTKISSIECALCRKIFPKSMCIQNFIVGDILNSLEVYDPPDKIYESDIIATQKITVKMLRDKNGELEGKLRAAINDSNRLKGYIQSSIAVFVCIFVLYSSNVKSYFSLLGF